jgi:hypothetical protein
MLPSQFRQSEGLPRQAPSIPLKKQTRSCGVEPTRLEPTRLDPLFIWTRSPSFIPPSNQNSGFQRYVHFSISSSVQCVSYRASLCGVRNGRHIMISRKTSQAFPFPFANFRMSLLTGLCNIYHGTEVPVRIYPQIFASFSISP